MQKTGKSGFTLIELLVVISIIALLLSILVPSLNKAKQLATASVCLSNCASLGKAYFLYSEENDGFLADGRPDEIAPYDGFYTAKVLGRNYNVHSFVANPHASNGAFSNTTLEDKIRGFENGALWEYLGDPEIFNCPSDKRWRKPPTVEEAISAQNSIGGYRSYSLGSVLSADAFASPYTAPTGENLAAIMKYSEFRSPGNKMTFLEEADGSGYNVNYWNVYLPVKKEQWWDPLAIWHNGSSTFAFADGHADRHKWDDANMLRMSEEGIKDLPVDRNSDDYTWFIRSYVPGRIRK